MPASSDRIDFSPPHEPGVTRAFVLAVIAHLLLMAALTWGIRWNRDVENLSAEAELWSSTPQQAAPKLVEPPPPPPPPPEPQQKVETPPPPPVVAPKAPDIALEREKKRQELARERQEELERQKKIEARKRQEDLKREQLAAKKEADERKRREDEQKQAKARKLQQEEEKQRQARRDEQIKRAQGLANATGGPTSSGTALRSSGPSASYAGRIAARIKPNIVFTDVISGNPATEVEIRVAPDGTIVGKRLLESSGVKSWDDAVLRAIDKTEVLPRDTDGSVVPRFPIRFRPHD
ncbi:cell envelope integrity protein TolA [Caenimonas aquaedulcis]|uniref:Cell envelope integrity protein TolA n=1 Tax=Caenimonas aquaedulcis TaxID=2793270 RepID=A0A931H2T2_9BURK|nr:cell envelope integrity protein TolA [Caenimonas aquaedulcis]MBG9387521.1 cell envelope integrity protein TolA [Caenimonas aquaedulcis]